MAPKTIFVQPNASGDGSSPLSPAKFARAFETAKTLQQATPNLPVILKVVGIDNLAEALPTPLEVNAINNGTITIQPEPAAAGGLTKVSTAGSLTFGSGVTVNDIQIILNSGDLTIEGKASKLIVKDTASVIDRVTVAAGATVTDSTIRLSNDFNSTTNQGDQLIVKGILNNSTVVAIANTAEETAIIELAGKLDGVTFSCKIGTPTSGNANRFGRCIKATAAGAQIINNSKVNFEAIAGAGAQATSRVVDAGNGVTIIGSVLKRTQANSTDKVIVVNHGGGALVVQNSTIDLNGTSDDDSRAVKSTAASGSIILTGNVFEGYNNANNKPVVDIGGALGAIPQQIANNQFLITNPSTRGIRSANAPSTLITQYATGSGNTFGLSSQPVVN